MSPLKVPVRLTTSRKEDGEEKTLGHWISIAVSSFLCLILVKWIWPSSTPFDTFQFFRENEIAEGGQGCVAHISMGGCYHQFVRFHYA